MITINIINTNNMKTVILVIGIILLVLGLIGLAYNFATLWMWALVVLGIIGIIWGWAGKDMMK